MRPQARLEILIGAVIALFVIIISPGWAATGAIAMIVLAVCGATVMIGRRRRRRRVAIRHRPQTRAVRPGGHR
jgi:hypothetical protein